MAGIRPTVVDRRPLVGGHPEHQNMYVLNGFGSRGVLIGPYASKQLFDYIENQTDLDPEMDIQRFTKNTMAISPLWFDAFDGIRVVFNKEIDPNVSG